MPRPQPLVRHLVVCAKWTRSCQGMMACLGHSRQSASWRASKALSSLLAVAAGLSTGGSELVRILSIHLAHLAAAKELCSWGDELPVITGNYW